MTQLYKTNKNPYYKVQTDQDKKYVLAVLAKYGLALDKPRSRVPFYIEIDLGYNDSANPNKRTYSATTIKNEKDCYGAIAPLNDFEDNVILECFPQVALDACQSIATTVIQPDARVIKSTLFTTKDGRIFGIYANPFENGNKFINVNLRDKNYFIRSTIEPYAKAVAIDYITA